MFVYLHGPHSAMSTWVREYAFAENDRTKERGLMIRFRDGAWCFYPGTTVEQYRGLHRAASKGRWVHRQIFNKPYRQI